MAQAAAHFLKISNNKRYFLICIVLFSLLYSFSIYASGDGSIKSLRPYPKFLSFLKGSEPREIEEIEGTWILKNLGEIKLRSDLMKNKRSRWVRQYNSLKNTINSVQIRCIKSSGKCFEAIAKINTDEIVNSKAPPGLEVEVNVWDIKGYNSEQLIATYYDGCYNFTVIIDINSGTVLKTGVATKFSPCHRGFTNKTVIYELKGGESAFNYMFD